MAPCSESPILAFTGLADSFADLEAVGTEVVSGQRVSALAMRFDEVKRAESHRALQIGRSRHCLQMIGVHAASDVAQVVNVEARGNVSFELLESPSVGRSVLPSLIWVTDLEPPVTTGNGASPTPARREPVNYLADFNESEETNEIARARVVVLHDSSYHAQRGKRRKV